MQFWALIVDSFRESVDRKIFWVLVGLTALVSAAMACIGFEPDRVDILFGLWEIDIAVFDPTTSNGRGNIASLAVSSMDVIVGWFGLVLTIIATASFFPTFMRSGTIDVLLSKPMSRSKIFLGKYLGSMVFVLIQAAFFGVATFLVIGLRWKTWLPGYLLMIPLIVLLFSYVYCISAWVAVSTRSAIAAILLSLGAWMAVTAVQSSGDVFELNPEWKEHHTVFYSARTLRWVLPKTQDVTYLAERWAGAGSGLDLMPKETAEQGLPLMDRVQALEQKRRNVNALHTIGSSLAFEAVIVMLAMWSFARKDY
jgi:ABC-type transport system involved in multi-copper enzyme maturation permease subunit